MDATMNGESDSQEDLLKCTKCNYSALSKRQLQRHTKQKHSPSKHTCEQCGEKFSRALMYKLHLATHNTTNEHACSTCGKTFPLVSLLKIHQETHSTESIHPCPHCSKQFRQKSALSKHVAFGHNKKNIHACTTCGQVFPSPSTLILHMDSHKNDKASANSSSSNAQQVDMAAKASLNLRTYSPYRRHIEHNMFKCQRCQKKFFTSSALARHMRIHANVQTHVCPECKKEFTSKKALQKHSSAHIFECDRCGRKYRQRVQLDHHLKNDCKGKLLICNVCGRIFGKNSSLRRHLEIHQETNKFQCPECCKNYKTQADLQTHQWLHKGDGYKCDDCGKAFGTKQHLIWHSYLHMTKFPVSGSDSELKKETDNSESNAEKEETTESESPLKPPPAATPSKIKKEKSETSDPSTSKEHKKESKAKTPSTPKTSKKEMRAPTPKQIKLEPKTPTKKTPIKIPKPVKKKSPTKSSEVKKAAPAIKKAKKLQLEKHAPKSSDVQTSRKTRLGTPSTKAPLKKKVRSKKSGKQSQNTPNTESDKKETPPATPVDGDLEEANQTIKEVEELIAQGVSPSVKRESIDVKDIPTAEVMFDDIDENVELDIREAIATLTEMGSHTEIEAEALIESIAAGVNQEEADDINDDTSNLVSTEGTGESVGAVVAEEAASVVVCNSLDVDEALQTDAMKEAPENLEALYAMDTDNDTETERDTELRDDESAQLLSELTNMEESQLESCNEMPTQTEMETQTDLDTLTENMNTADIPDELVSHINMEVVDVINQSSKEIENLCKPESNEEANAIVNSDEIVNEIAKDSGKTASESSSSHDILGSEVINITPNENFNVEASEMPNEPQMDHDTDPAKLPELPQDPDKASELEQESETNYIAKAMDEANEPTEPQETSSELPAASEADKNISEEPSSVSPDKSAVSDESKIETDVVPEVSIGETDTTSEQQCQHDCEKCAADFGIGIKRTICPHNKELKVVIEKLDCKDCPGVESSGPASKPENNETPVPRTRRSASMDTASNMSDTAKSAFGMEEDLSRNSPSPPNKSPSGSSRLRRRVRQSSGARSVSTKSCDTRRRESLSSNPELSTGKLGDLSGMTTRSANQRVTRYTRGGIPLSDFRESRKATPGSDRKHVRKPVSQLTRKKVESEKSPPPRYKVSTVTDLTIRITTQDSTGNSQQVKKSLSPREDTSATPKAPQRPTYTVSTSPSQDPNQLSKLYISKSPPGYADGRPSATVTRSPSDEALRRNSGSTQELCVVLDDINELILMQQERLRKMKHLKPVRLSKDLDSVHPLNRKRKNRSEESLNLSSDPEPRPTKVFLKLPKDRVRKHEQRLAYIDKQFQDMSELEKVTQMAKERKRAFSSPGHEEAREYQQPDSSQDTQKNKHVIRIPKVPARKGMVLGTLRTINKNSAPASEGAAKALTSAASEKPSLSNETVGKKAYKQAGDLNLNTSRSVLSVEECDSTSMAESNRHAASAARSGSGGSAQSASTNKREKKSAPAKASSSDEQSSDDVVYEPLDLSIRINQFAPTEVKPDPDGESREESTDVDTHEDFCSCTDNSSQQGDSSQSSSLPSVSVKVEPEASAGSARRAGGGGNANEYCSTDAQAGDVAYGGVGGPSDTADNVQYSDTGDAANGDDGAGAAAEFIEVIDRATQCELGDEVLYCPDAEETNQ